MVYGSELSITDPGPFLSSLQNGDTKVAVGTDANGARVLLLGVPANYCMSAGDDALALVADSLGVDLTPGLWKKVRAVETVIRANAEKHAQSAQKSP